MEFKAYPWTEVKSDESGTFSGYAATYKRDAYGDRIEPGAFEKTIKAKDGRVPIFLDHDRSDWVGFSTELSADAKGLHIKGLLSLDSSRGRDAYALLKTAAAVEFRMGLSIGFTADKWDVDPEDGGRILKAINLWETSITPFPAGRGTWVQSVKSVRNVEQILRDVGGCSKEGAKRTLALLQPYLLSDESGEPPNSERDARTLRHLSSAVAALKEAVHAGRK